MGESVDQHCAFCGPYVKADPILYSPACIKYRAHWSHFSSAYHFVTPGNVISISGRFICEKSGGMHMPITGRWSWTNARIAASERPDSSSANVLNEIATDIQSNLKRELRPYLIDDLSDIVMGYIDEAMVIEKPKRCVEEHEDCPPAKRQCI